MNIKIVQLEPSFWTNYTNPRLWRSDGSDSQEAPIVSVDVLLDGETLTVLFSDTLLEACFSLVFLAMLGLLCILGLWETSGFGGESEFAFVPVVILILLSLSCNGFSSVGNLLGT